MKRVTKALSMVLVAFALICAAMPSAFAAESSIKVISHRGNTGSNSPENTMYAFAQAAKLTGYIESDVRFTLDGVPVLCHDSTINRTARMADGSRIPLIKTICTMRYNELLKYDFGAAYGVPGLQIPTFEQWIRFCSENGIVPYIEMKESMTGSQISKLISIVDKYGMGENVVWISFSYYGSNLMKLAYLEPNAAMGVIAYAVDTATLSLCQVLKASANSVFLDVNYTGLNAASVSRAGRAGLSVEAWTVDDAESIERVKALGITGITTNYPDTVLISAAA